MSPAIATIVDVVERCDAAFDPSPHLRIGAEVEWLVFQRDDRTRHVSADTTAFVAQGSLPAGGRVSVEPGGQLELSTTPFAGPAALLEAVEADTRVLIERFARVGLDLFPLGLDTVRPSNRSLGLARYEAMERYFAERWPAGIDMMTRTASLQLNIDLGTQPVVTWRRAHQLAPFFATIFANSPGVGGPRISHRQRIWAATDPSRTRSVGPDPGDWLTYVLDSFVMLRVRDRSGVTAMCEQASLADLLASEDPLTLDELDLHVSTLFPPVRPRRHLELRMIDAVPLDGRAAAIATTWALLTDPSVDADIADICESVSDPWELALDRGLADGRLRRAAVELLTLAAARLRPGSGALADACETWRDGRVVGSTAPTLEEMFAREPLSSSRR